VTPSRPYLKIALKQSEPEGHSGSPLKVVGP